MCPWSRNRVLTGRAYIVMEGAALLLLAYNAWSIVPRAAMASRGHPYLPRIEDPLSYLRTQSLEKSSDLPKFIRLEVAVRI